MTVVAVSVRSSKLMMIAHIPAGFVVAMIALAITLHINKRQNDSARGG